MLRALVASGLLAVSTATLLASAPVAAQGVGSTQCNQTPAAKAKRSMFGSILGGLADSALGRLGAPSSIAGVSLPVGSMLSDAIVNLLDCKEQQQAAKATDTALRGGVGTEVKWTSESRPNVSGRSTVTAEQQLADGGQCMTVTDVVIVDGEETMVPKKMCRAKGASGFAKV
jgi:surface antigen